MIFRGFERTVGEVWSLVKYHVSFSVLGCKNFCYYALGFILLSPLVTWALLEVFFFFGIPVYSFI